MSWRARWACSRYTGFLSDVLSPLPGSDSRPGVGHAGGSCSATSAADRGGTDPVPMRFSTFWMSFLREHSPGRGDYDQRLRLTSGLRVQPAWSNVEITWDNLSSQLHPIVKDLERLCGGLSELDGFDIPDLEGMVQDCVGHVTRLHEMREQINACIAEPSSSAIYWASSVDPGRAGDTPRGASARGPPGREASVPRQGVGDPDLGYTDD